MCWILKFNFLPRITGKLKWENGLGPTGICTGPGPTGIYTGMGPTVSYTGPGPTTF